MLMKMTPEHFKKFCDKINDDYGVLSLFNTKEDYKKYSLSELQEVSKMLDKEYNFIIKETTKASKRFGGKLLLTHFNYKLKLIIECMENIREVIEYKSCLKSNTNESPNC